jgi:hypothetical protein
MLFLICGSACLLSGTMIVINLRRVLCGKRGRGKDLLLMILWGIIFLVFAAPFILLLITPHK